MYQVKDSVCHEYYQVPGYIYINLDSVLPLPLWLLFISGAIAYFGGYFGTRSSPSFITNVNCRGLPSRILDCSYSAVSATASCNQASDAGVMCIGKLIESVLKVYACNFCMVYGRNRQLCMFQAWVRTRVFIPIENITRTHLLAE